MFLWKKLYLQPEAYFVLLEGSSHPILRLHSLLDRLSSFLLGASIEGNVAAAPKSATTCDIGCEVDTPPSHQLESVGRALSVDTCSVCCLGNR